MSDEKYFDTLNYERQSETISIKPSPKEVLDVKPEILANMKARLKGESFFHIHDISNRKVDELSIMREKVKLRRVFGTPLQLKESFSSIKNVKTIRDEITFEEVNKTLLSKYALTKSNGRPVDEMDIYNALLFSSRWLTKEERVKRYYTDFAKSNDVFAFLLEWYELTHFNTLRITKEVIQMDNGLLHLFQERKLVSLFDDLLNDFYGWVA